MDLVLQAYEYLNAAVGDWGVAVLAVILATFLVQLCYYAGAYGRIPKYRNRKGAAERAVEGISVVVVVHQDVHFVEHTLPLLMGQDYADFEVVVVDVGSDSDFRDSLAQLKDIYPRLTTTQFEENSRFAISNKMALNVGIKAAKYPYVVITTADAAPRSERWLPLMAKGFAKGDIVLGYCALECPKGLAGKLMRSTRLMTGVRFLSAAIKGRPYRGMLQNLGISRKLYFDSRGFDHLNMNIGEDDLYIQRIATKHNTSIVMHQNAATAQYCDGGMKRWRRMRRFYGAAYRYYPGRAKRFVATELISRAAFLLAVVYMAVVSPVEVRIAVGALWLIRLFVVETAIVRIGRRLGDTGLAWAYPLHDLWAPFDELWMLILRTAKPVSGIWR